MGNLTVKESGEMVNIISPNVSNITSFKVHFSPRQEGEGDPSPDNVREITGWNGVEGYSCGKNLLDLNMFNNTGHYISDRGNIVSSEDFKYTSPIFLKKGDYIFSGINKISSTANIRIHAFDKNNLWIKQIAYKSAVFNGLYNIPFQVTDDMYYIRISAPVNLINAQLELGSQATSYEPYQVTTTSIDWAEDIGTVYGGYVDLISGELVQEYYKFTYNGNLPLSIRPTSNDNISIITHRDLAMNSSIIRENNSPFFCNYCKSYDNLPIDSELTFWIGAFTSTNWFRIYAPSSLGSTSDEINAYFIEHPFEICYKATSQYYRTYQLTPQQLSTLKGQNNFWSNADYVEIEYELTETFDIQKAKRKIILSQPHVESASGDLVTFDTDMKGKLKECKVYFSPVQEGKGDPSPDNVRNIVGWNGVKLYCCGKNLFQYENGAKSILNLKKGTTITISQSAESDLGYFRGYDINNNAVTGIIWINEGIENNRRYKNYTLIDDVYYGVIYTGTGIKEAQVTINGTIDYEPYQSNIINIDWAEDIGTIYGGYIDIVSGELVQTHYLAEITTTGLTSQNTQYDTIEDSIYFSINHSFPQMLSSYSSGADCTHSNGIGVLPVDCKTNYLKPVYADNWRGTTYVNSLTRAYSSSNFSIRMARDITGVSSEDTAPIKAQKINDYLMEHPLQVYYKLETPIHYQLTPQQLIVPRGINTIHSNINEQINIKYWTYFSKFDYMKNVQWLDYSYITSAGKLTEESTALSHTTVNSILLPAGNYRIDGFCYQEPPANSLNYRVHEYSAGGSWVKLITSNTASTMSPYILEFSLDHDSYIKLSLPRLLDAKLIKI